MSKLGITRPTATVKLWRDQDVFREWEAKNAQLQALAADLVQDQREVDPKAKLAAEVRDLEGRMDESAVTFEIQALPRKRFTELELEHKVREGVTVDEQWGVNMSTFIDAVMSEPGTILAVYTAAGDQMDFGPDDWAEAADEMANGQWETFAVKVFEVNRGRVSAPKSRLASLVMQNSASS